MTTTTTTISGGILPKEYQDLRDTVADFARTVVAPVSAKHDAEHSFPYEIVAKMGEMGLFGLPFPGGVRRHGRRLLRAVAGT